jgi:hypothetical protein
MRIALISVPILGVIQLSRAAAVAHHPPSSEEIVGLSKPQALDALASRVPFNQVAVIEPTTQFTEVHLSKRASGDKSGNAEVSVAPKSLSSPEIQKLIADNRKKIVEDANDELAQLHDKAVKSWDSIVGRKDGYSPAAREAQAARANTVFEDQALLIANKAKNAHDKMIGDLAESRKPDPANWLAQKEAEEGWTGLRQHKLFAKKPRPPKSGWVGTDHPLNPDELLRQAETIAKHAYY